MYVRRHLVVLAVLLCGCGWVERKEDGGGVADLSSDVVDAVADLSSDVVDAGVDVKPDLPRDAGTDARDFSWPDGVDARPPCGSNKDCIDNITCTTDTCTKGKCSNKVEGHCLIDNKCIKANTDNPANDCQLCDPKIKTDGWTTKANGTKCTDDKLSCTDDICTAGKCTHQAATKKCLIDGKTCVSDGQKDTDGCRICDTNKSQTTWTNIADKTTCNDDGLSCTTDLCASGVCNHEVTTGCKIGGKCVAEGAPASGTAADPCKLCVSTSSKAGYTFVAGPPCTTSAKTAGFCIANTCKGFSETTFDASGSEATRLVAVTHVSAANAVWAAGHYTPPGGGADKGVLVEAGKGTEVATTNPLRGIHHRAAVGDKGEMQYHDGTKWGTFSALSGSVGSGDLAGVWGVKFPTEDVYFVTGKDSINKCTAWSASSGKCEKHSGLASGVTLTRVFGTLTSGGNQGPLWAVATGTGSNADIYHNSGSTDTTWDTSPPQGCVSKSSSICGTTSQAMDLGGSSAKDLWVVGTAGLVLRHDGSAWSRVTNTIVNKSDHDLTAVYSSAKDKLTSVAVTYKQGINSVGRKIYLFNYNHDLKKWFGPVLLLEVPGSHDDQVHDIGGKDYGGLWLVGHRKDKTSGKVSGWMLQLK